MEGAATKTVPVISTIKQRINVLLWKCLVIFFTLLLNGCRNGILKVSRDEVNGGSSLRHSHEYLILTETLIRIYIPDIDYQEVSWDFRILCIISPTRTFQISARSRFLPSIHLVFRRATNVTIIAERSPVTGPGAWVVAGTLVAVRGEVIDGMVAIPEVTDTVVGCDRGTNVLSITMLEPL
jgi:hypothetical protein